RRYRALTRGDDRDLDRNGLARWLLRLDRDREPAVPVRGGHLPDRRGFRRGVHWPRQPRHHGWSVLPERPGHRRGRRLPVERIVELRVWCRAFAIRRGR